MDSFCEMVGSGLKKLALSHTWDTREERDQYQEEVDALCEKYQVRAFAEDELLITPLFPEEICRGKFLFLFYRENEVMERYLSLKGMGAAAAKSHEAAMEFGRLLSYPETRLREMLGDRD